MVSSLLTSSIVPFTLRMSSGDVGDVLTFEKGRIQALRQERISVQQKTFTKWVNSYLAKVRKYVVQTMLL